LILKQGAELERRHSVKGQKDKIDILTLLIYSGFELKKYNKLILRFKLGNYMNELRNVIEKFDTKDVDYLDMNLKKFVNWKKEYIKLLK